ncbi:MAG: hypothetical protein SGILL_004782, partial [Bacillariaceae sp.]
MAVDSVQDLEDWLMEELDNMITTREEKEIMQNLDDMIVQREEEHIMKELLGIVHESQDLEFEASFPSRVRNLITIGEEKEETAEEETPNVWNHVYHRKRKRRGVKPTAGETMASPKSSLVQQAETVEIKRGRQKLPKWAPSPLDNKVQELLFTREDFWETVVQKVTNMPEFQGANFIPSTDIKISKDHPDDPDSYMLEAKGTEELLAQLRVFTNGYVRFKIADANLRMLLADEHSIMLTVSANMD